MPIVIKHKLLIRLFALGILMFCLILVSRTGGNSSVEFSSETSAALLQTQQPTITVERQPHSPLTITSVAAVGRMAPESEFFEFGFYVINSSSKSIRAYAIRQQVFVNGSDHGGGVSLYHPQLSGSEFRASQSTFIGDTVNLIPGKTTVINLSVDFVELTDGTKWGPDSTGAAEKVAGQRSAAYMISKELLQILSARNGEAVMNAIESEMANLEPPRGRSQEWAEGFRSGRVIIISRLKRCKEKNGFKELERELRRLGETFKSKD